MKIMIKLSVVLGLMFVLTGTTQKVMAQNEDVSLQSFYDELSPYGTWIKDPQYGYVWRPDVDQDEFRPYYSNGRWAMTEYGNTWVSNYDWGWAPFHYGRWIYNRYNDWVWIPDTVWGPAWVSWRSGGGYYGWAPLGPSISIGINFGRSGYRIPDMCWNFIPYNNIYYNSYPRYYGGRNRVYIQNTVIINNTYVRNNRTYYTGPRAEEVRRATNQNVTVYNINRSNRPGASRIERNSVDIYNPRPSRGVNNNDAAPRNAVQGNITRGAVGRDQNANVGSRPSRGEGDVFQGDRNGSGRGTDNMATRPSRGGSDAGQIDRSGNTSGRSNGTDNMSTRPSRGGSDAVQMDRSGNITGRGTDNMPTRPSRGSDAGTVQPQPNRSTENRGPQNDGNRPDIFNRSREANPSQPQRAERGSQEPQRVERSREMPPQQQAQPQQRTERPQPVQQAPQRMERPQPQPQRVERTQSAPQRSSGSSSESRGSRGESGGSRPGRGGK